MKLSLKDLATKQNGAIAAGAVSALDSAIPDEVNADFRTRNAKLFSFDDGANKVRKGLEGAALTSGNPYAMAAGAISAVGRQVDKAAKDEFGIYKSTGAAIADRILDPIGNIQDLFGGVSQKELKHKKKVFHHENAFREIDKNARIGAGIKNSTPGFTAPAYGRRGMKFKTKFSY